MAADDQGAGQRLFRQRCSVCHSDPAATATMEPVGPNLAGVVDRPKGSAPGFNRYSPAMKKARGAWTPGELDAFLASPAKAVPGTTMIFPGLSAPQDRAAMIRYLGSTKATPK